MQNSTDSLAHLSQEVNRLHADICSALADPSPILILYLLAERDYTVNDLASRLTLTQPSTSRQLTILREHGLVHANRQAQNVVYSLRDSRIIEALDLLRSVLRDTLSQRARLISE